ncbi:type 1 glutamine amidotransferase family protein [Chryseobacterium kimseyorum]|uniref:hypothetical protein n=1 Tax=Chryseobacterium kimseyorum TaxID=2984028 RepID=UPI00222833BB|nr:hypothetical protein [Chryseobacterium kimseyorum]
MTFLFSKLFSRLLNCFLYSNYLLHDAPRSTWNKRLELQQGLGFLNNCIVDIQYSQKISYNKLAYTVVKHHDLLGFGLGSGTVLIVQNGFVGVCKGDGTIMLVNARETKRVRKILEIQIDHSMRAI